MTSHDDPQPAQQRETPLFDDFYRHAKQLRDMQRELLSRQGEDPASIIEAEGELPSVLEIAVELALDDAHRHGELAVALGRAAGLDDARRRGDAIVHAWNMAGEAIVWEAGQRAAPTVHAALRRRGVHVPHARPRR